MWVVKLGGSLNGDEALREWLELLARLGGGRVTVVCGGGGFADEVRRAQAQWRFDDLCAHNMAVLAMAQSSYLAQGLVPALQLASKLDDIRQVLHGGRTALWLPYDHLHERPHATADWDLSADSIALELARRLNAERLVVVKSCPVDPAAGLAELGAGGVLDKRFAGIAAGAAFPIDVVHKSETARVRSLLLGQVRSFEQ
jgi:aspartokinase-like uncharacterized kinase